MPVEDAHVRNEIEAIFKALLADNSQAWELQSDGTWQRVTPKKGERRRPAQAHFMRRRERARRLAAVRLEPRRHVGSSPCCRAVSGSSMSARTPCACSSRRTGEPVLSPARDARPRRLHRARRRRSRATKLAETAGARRVASSTRRASAGAVDVEVLITSPGRQAANGTELLDAIAAATDCSRRASSAPQEEGRLAFVGALGSAASAGTPARRGRRRRRRLGPGRRRLAAATGIDLERHRSTSARGA